eukprot:4900483-Karenia_brevis.AAC.1
MARFAVAAGDLGLEFRRKKCKCFSFGADLAANAHRPNNMPFGRLWLQTDELGLALLLLAS